MKRDVEYYLADYSTSHETLGNRITHFIGIPLIIISILGFLDRLVIAQHVILGLPLTSAVLLYVASGAYYIWLHQRLGVAVVLFLTLLYWISLKLSLAMLIGLFILGWILQLFGHYYYEKKKPAFAQNIIHLLIGPLYIVNKITRLYPRKKDDA